MSKTRQDYVTEGRSVARQYPSDYMPLFGQGTSWQAKAFADGWKSEHHKALASNLTTMLEGKCPDEVRAEPEQRPAQLRREWQINAMLDGYTEAMLWSSGGEPDPDDEDTMLESLQGYDLAEKTVSKARDICTRFYDANRTDLAAYADLKKHAPEHGPYECIGHDLWLTTAGHGVGFWDRGMGRVGDRLTAQCGYGKPFSQLDAYLGDDRLVYLS